MKLGGPTLPVERVNATSLSSFIACPEAFRKRYLLKQKERLGGERFIGSVTHKALQALFEDGDPEQVVNSAWQNVIDSEGEPDWRENEDAAEMYRRTKMMIKTYLPALDEKPIAVEQRFEERIAGVTVSGYIDKEMSDRILEVKTTGAKVSKPKSRWSFQGRLYSLVSAKPIEWHVLTRQVTPVLYTAKECPDLYVRGFNSDATVAIVRQAVERMSDLYTRYGKDRTWPMDGIFGDWTCRYCSFRSDCPAHREIAA